MRKAVFLFAGLALAAMVCLGAQAARAESKGVTDDTIKLGSWGPQTGPAALWGAITRGTDLMFKMVNDEGGINGRKVQFISGDDQYNPEKAAELVKKLISQDGVFAMACGVGTPSCLAVMPLIEKAGLPWVGMATGAALFGTPAKKGIFAVYPSYDDEARILARHVMEQMGVKKLGLIYSDTGYGKPALDNIQAELSAMGASLAAAVPVPLNDADLSAHVAKLQQAGAEAVIIWLTPKQAALAVISAAKLGYKPKWIATSALSDFVIMGRITKGLWKGVIFANFIELPDSANPLMAKYRAAHQKFAPKERWGVFYYSGIGFVEPMVEGLKKAGRDLNAESFNKAMESMDGFQGIMGKVSFAPGKHQGCKAIFLAEYMGGNEAKQLTDWIVSK